MEAGEMEGILAFIKRAENLKNTLRHSFTSAGRGESAAEHSWRLCLLVMAFANALPGLDIEKCLKLAVIHDLAEAVCGDTPAINQDKSKNKSRMEEAALIDMLQPLQDKAKKDFLGLWREYEQACTPEAVFVKALDKIETLIQHNQGVNPQDFNYAFNLTYGLDATNKLDVTAKLRQILDEETRSRVTSGHVRSLNGTMP